MKKAIVVILAAGAIAGGTAILAADRDLVDDRAVVDDAIKDMSAEDLTAEPEPDVEHGPPPLTKEVALAVIEDLKDIEGAGGILAIARKHGASMAQVKVVQKAVDARLHAVTPDDHQVVEPK